MNMYQKLGFGVFGILLAAWLLQDKLTMLMIAAFVVALMTLATTWLIVFSVTQFTGHIIGEAGHGVGKFGDMIVHGSRNIKAQLRAPRSAVPTWDTLTSSEDGVPPLHDGLYVDFPDAMPETADAHEELNVPSFMDGVLERQNS